MKIVDLDLGFDLADLNDLKNLSKENFIESMCYFIPEVFKKNDELYPGPSLYQMCVAIQKYLQQDNVEDNRRSRVLRFENCAGQCHERAY